MLDRTNDTDSLSELVRCLRAMVDAAANIRAEEVYGHLAHRLCAFDGTGRTITSATPLQESGGTVSMGAFFKFGLDPQRYTAPRSPRRFDVLSFGAMRLMDAGCSPNTGQGFFYQPLPASVDGIPKYYLRFGNGGRGAGARVYVTRIIVDAGGGRAARFAEEHHSYRRKDLLTIDQKNNSRLPKGEHGRSQAVRLAVQMFGALARDGVSVLEYEALLLDLLKFADVFHGEEVTQAPG
ncbi:MAG: hypothetical protein KGL35_19205 [Bradyrhizobium sp.]|uniref:hypothetical protein n=1 Tax=Bradyrhizobium sp. TaxID=376 RepID=UPI002399B53B|nr:hypothetical protein [Bradyrhizobium sp.]MDE2066045.1 hypothetical protein [Bradyrhizobium sp.]MDE2470810.1 hypothetical protein [Bradyrhizobium sp.]